MGDERSWESRTLLHVVELDLEISRAGAKAYVDLENFRAFDVRLMDVRTGAV